MFHGSLVSLKEFRREMSRKTIENAKDFFVFYSYFTDETNGSDLITVSTSDQCLSSRRHILGNKGSLEVVGMAGHSESSLLDVVGQDLMGKDLLVPQLGVAVNLFR